MAASSSNLARAKTMDEGNHKVAQGCQNLGSISRAELRKVFVKTHITHVMQTVFNAPCPLIRTRRRSGSASWGVKLVMR